MARTAKVFGVGFHKTGTTSLKHCMLHWGLVHATFDAEAFHLYRRGDVERLLAFLEDIDSCEDWPWALLFRELDARFPEGRFVLTTRSSSAVWYESLRKHAERGGPTEVRRAIYGHAMPDGHRDHDIALYEAHNAAVREHFRGRPGKLLEVCWERGDGWDELARFLGLPRPARPFPHANRAPAA